MKAKKMTVILMMILVLSLAAGCAKEEPVPVIEAAAVVNGVPIAMADYESSLAQTIATYEQYGITFDTEESEPLKKEISDQVIQTLVDNEILLQEARERGFDISQERLAEELEILKGQFTTPEEYDTALSAAGYTEEDLMAMMADEIVINDYLMDLVKAIEISEEEIAAYYEDALITAQAQYDDLEDPEEPFSFPTLEESVEAIKSELLAARQQEIIEDVIEGLRETADIEILL